MLSAYSSSTRRPAKPPQQALAVDCAVTMISTRWMRVKLGRAKALAPVSKARGKIQLRLHDSDMIPKSSRDLP